MTDKNQQQLLVAPVRVEVKMVREDTATTVPSTIRTPEDASAYANALRESDRECFAVILVTTKNSAIGLHVCGVGTLNACLVSPMTVFRPALLANAACVVLTHNHPSGDPTPSAEDLRITKQLVKAGCVIDVQVLDHVVLGSSGTFTSLREAGLADFSN